MPLNPIPEPRLEIYSDQTLSWLSRNQVEQEKGQEGQLDNQRMQVEEFFTAVQFSATTQKSYRIELERFLTWSQKGWSEVTPQDIIHFKRYLQDECKTRRGKSLSPSSVNQALIALKSFYKWLYRSGYLGEESGTIIPTDRVALEKVDQQPPRQLKQQQMEAIVQSILGNDEMALRDRALLGVLIHGLQAKEIVELNIENYEGDRLRFTRYRDQREAIVPLRQMARDYLQHYLERRQQGEDISGDSPLFLSYDRRSPGQRLGYPGIYHFTKNRLGAAAGIPDLTPHRFRQTYATELIELGIDSLLARSLTGHRSEKAFQRYLKEKSMTEAEDAFFQAIQEAPSS